jgi:hypothetical protein
MFQDTTCSTRTPARSLAHKPLLRDISTWITSYLTVFQECPSFVDLKHVKYLCSVLDWQVDFIADNNDNNPEYNKSLHIHRINRNFLYYVKHVTLSSLALVRTPSLPTWILTTKSWLLKVFGAESTVKNVYENWISCPLNGPTSDFPVYQQYSTWCPPF